MGLAEIVTDIPITVAESYVERVIGYIRREYLDQVANFNGRHLSLRLAFYYHRTRTLLFARPRIAPTPAQSCRTGSERWSKSRKSAACIVATSALRPDSQQLFANGLTRAGPTGVIA
jgi:hypothetical protein